MNKEERLTSWSSPIKEWFTPQGILTAVSMVIWVVGCIIWLVQLNIMVVDLSKDSGSVKATQEQMTKTLASQTIQLARIAQMLDTTVAVVSELDKECKEHQRIPAHPVAEEKLRHLESRVEGLREQTHSKH